MIIIISVFASRKDEAEVTTVKLEIKPEEWHVETADLDSDGQDELLLIHTAGNREVLLFRLNAQGGIDKSDAPFLAPTAIGTRRDRDPALAAAE